MILWLLLFFLTVAISFVLAYQSMRDYQENPGHFKIEYSLFLIRSPEALNINVLKAIEVELSKENLIISLERLFKGTKTALVIFGPKIILQKFSTTLNLLELEEYTKQAKDGQISVWEMGVKGR